MDFLFAYLFAGIVISWAADSYDPLPVWQRLALITLWLPGIILVGIIARKARR